MMERVLMSDAPAAIRALFAEIVGGALVIAWIFVGVTCVVTTCTIIDHGKKIADKLRGKKT